MAQNRQLVRTRYPGIYRRGEGYVAYWRDALGRQRTRTLPTIAAARAFQAERVEEARRGSAPVDDRITVAAYASEWLATYAGRTSRGLREGTRADYGRKLRPVLARLGRRRLSELTARDVEAVVREMADAGLAPDTIRLRVAPLRAMLSTAHARGLIRANPLAGVRLRYDYGQRGARATRLEGPGGHESGSGADQGPGDQEEVRALTEAQARALVLAVPERWRLIVAVLIATGLRSSEAAALEWRDLRLEDDPPTLRVMRAWTDGVVGPGKSKYARRRVVIPHDLAHALLALREARGDGPRDYVLRAPRAARTERLNGDNLNTRVIRPAAVAIGCPWLTLHGLRHTACTLWLRGGVSIKAVQVMMGHHSPAFTLDRYAHLLDDDLRDAPACVSGLLLPGPGAARDDARALTDDQACA